MINRQVELLPCPFCGKTDAYVERPDLTGCAVFCNNCSARGPESCTEDDNDLAYEEKHGLPGGYPAAIRSWNAHALTDREAKIVDELKSAIIILEALESPIAMNKAKNTLKELGIE